MVKDGKVLRFGRVAIMTHWTHTVTFFLLAVTGLFIYADAFDFLLPLFGGKQGARLVHRIAAVGFIMMPLIGLWRNPKGFTEWMQSVLSWGKNDFAFFSAFVQEFFGGHPEVPPQGRFNAGEKANSLLQLGGCTILAVTGLIIWFKELFPTALVAWSIPLHDVAFILTATAVLGHAYLALFHPATKEAINGMISGYIDADFAKSHYPLWYKEVEKVGRLGEGPVAKKPYPLVKEPEEA